jgi:hypothetical protein
LAHVRAPLRSYGAAAGETVWPSGLRRWLKAPVRKGAAHMTDQGP